MHVLAYVLAALCGVAALALLPELREGDAEVQARIRDCLARLPSRLSAASCAREADWRPDMVVAFAQVAGAGLIWLMLGVLLRRQGAILRAVESLGPARGEAVAEEVPAAPLPPAESVEQRAEEMRAAARLRGLEVSEAEARRSAEAELARQAGRQGMGARHR